jgi:hypothetical protein
MPLSRNAFVTPPTIAGPGNGLGQHCGLPLVTTFGWDKKPNIIKSCAMHLFPTMLKATGILFILSRNWRRCYWQHESWLNVRLVLHWSATVWLLLFHLLQHGSGWQPWSSCNRKKKLVRRTSNFFIGKSTISKLVNSREKIWDIPVHIE